MIRGILGTVQGDDLVPGAFYLQPGYSSASRLFQFVAPVEGQNNKHFGLVFDPGAEPELYIAELEEYAPFVLMPEVSIRIDPPSISGTRFTQNLRTGTFFVAGDVPYVAALSGRFGYQVVNLATGMIEQRNIAGDPWVSFARWQLVVDENQEEIPIASFGEAPGSN